MAAKKLIIVHGWTYSIEPWTATVSVLRSSGIEVRQLRVPGLTSESSAVWDIDSYVEWLRTELEGEKDFVLLGHSNGGRIAMNLLLKFPGTFRHLILLNSAGTYENEAVVSLKRRVFRALTRVFRVFRHIPVLRKVVYKIAGGGDYNRAPENMKKTLHNMLESDKHLAIKDIETSTSVIWGENDTVTPLAQGKKVARLLPNSSFVTFKEWGHAPYITHPNQLADAILHVMEET